MENHSRKFRVINYNIQLKAYDSAGQKIPVMLKTYLK